MNKQFTTISLLSFALFGLLSSSAKADDTAVIQTSEQGVEIVGNGNSAVQVNQQFSKTIKRNVPGQPGGNVGVVQQTVQGTGIYGSGNATYQENTQINVNQQVNKRPKMKGKPASIQIQQH